MPGGNDNSNDRRHRMCIGCMPRRLPNCSKKNRFHSVNESGAHCAWRWINEYLLIKRNWDESRQVGRCCSSPQEDSSKQKPFLYCISPVTIHMPMAGGCSVNGIAETSRRQWSTKHYNNIHRFMINTKTKIEWQLKVNKDGMREPIK